ncbi:MAG: GIY-YIG nuclease family protein [Porticoccaceae bacterium]|jgi:putative endonuclease|nr:GIY-YIG nuclease family protein [Porticoccaceae bacterium]MDG1494243.1 GIY-YIG nuclease family protein [Porticoccaceae bacterium]
MNEWFVYLIRATDQSVYTGITTDVERRFNEHLSGRAGAKYFRGRSPVEVVFTEGGHNRSSASIRESQIKKLSRQQKLNLIKG